MAKLTQKAIMRTFDEMIREMPFDKITVSALVDRCEISSNTFYYHYQDIYALLDQYISIKLSRDSTQSYLDDEWKDAVKNLMHQFQDNPKVVYHIFDSISRDRLERYTFHVLERDIEKAVGKRVENMRLSQDTRQMLTSAFCYSLCGFVIKFVYDGMSADIDETFDPIIDFLDFGIIKYAERESMAHEKDID